MTVKKAFSNLKQTHRCKWLNWITTVPLDYDESFKNYINNFKKHEKEDEDMCSSCLHQYKYKLTGSCGELYEKNNIL